MYTAKMQIYILDSASLGAYLTFYGILQENIEKNSIQRDKNTFSHAGNIVYDLFCVYVH